MEGPFLLGPDPEFPPPAYAAEEGLLAVGGELTPEWLLTAYRSGIFPWPWYDDQPMFWWCPDPRFVLYPAELKVSKSLAQRVRSGRFEVRLDTAFTDVIRACADTPRPDQPGTWITEELLAAYVRMFELGYAHCAEAWRDGRLVGGLYGIALGGVFFGESMFFRETDASKVAFVTLVGQLEKWGFQLIDCQTETDHLINFGARAIARSHFLVEITEAQTLPNRAAPWRLD